MSSSPPHTTSEERVVDVTSDSPALMRTESSQDVVEGPEDLINSGDSDSEPNTGVPDLEFSEHEYRRGRHAILIQSPGDEPRIARSARQRGQLPSLHKRRFFEGETSSGYESGPQRGRILQRIIFRRRKRGEDDAFWTGIFLSTVFSLFLMIFLWFYLMQTDFFESHQNDLFGTTVDERFTVVSPESSDAKITLKSGYSTSKYSEAMIAFGSGELRVGRRALGHSDTQSFYGLSIASNGSASFTNKVNVPFIKTEYLHTSKALVFDDGTVMTTAANLTGGLSEVGDLNLVSKTGSISLSTGGKPVITIDHDALISILDTESDDPQATGISMQASTGDISIAGSFSIHHDDDSTVVSSTNPIQLNTTHLILGGRHNPKAVLTCPTKMQDNATSKAPLDDSMTLEIIGQSGLNYSRGGDVVIFGGNGTVGGSVIIHGGVGSNSSDAMSRGSVLINAGLDLTTPSVTEIGSHSSHHTVNLHGAVAVNNAPDSGHPTTLTIGGGETRLTSKTITLSNAETNGSEVRVKSNAVAMEASGSSLRLDASSASLEGDMTVLLHVPSPAINSSAVKNETSPHSVASILMDKSGTLEVSATLSINVRAIGANASTSFYGPVIIGADDAGHDGNGTTGAPDLVVDNGAVTIDAETLSIGASGSTTDVMIKANRVHLGDSKTETNVTISGERARVTSKLIHVGSSGSHVTITGESFRLRSDAAINIGGSNETEVTINGSAVTITGERLQLGDSNSEQIVIGDSSAGISVSSKNISVGSSAKTIGIGGTTSSIKIGAPDSTVELHGKVTVNGESLETVRRLESEARSIFAIASSDRLAVTLSPIIVSQLVIPIQVDHASRSEFMKVTGDQVRFSENIVFTHLQMSLSIDSARLQVSADETTPTRRTKRQPKLWCSVHSVATPSVQAVQVVVPLETCDDVEDCATGVFVGGSSHKIIAASPGDQYQILCQSGAAEGTLLVDRVQFDVVALL